jgi:hypothetical protein
MGRRPKGPKAFTPREQIEETRQQMEEFAREMRGWEAAKRAREEAKRLDALSAEIDKLKRGDPGRPPGQRKDWALAEIRRMIEGGKKVTATTLRVAWEAKFEPIPGQKLDSQVRQFYRWIAVVKKTRQRRPGEPGANGD